MVVSYRKGETVVLEGLLDHVLGHVGTVQHTVGGATAVDSECINTNGDSGEGKKDGFETHCEGLEGIGGDFEWMDRLMLRRVWLRLEY